MKLVERLREPFPLEFDGATLVRMDGERREAADRIEQLERELIKIRDCPGYCCSECGTIARRTLED